jgi:hypothetical protein
VVPIGVGPDLVQHLLLCRRGGGREKVEDAFVKRSGWSWSFSRAQHMVVVAAAVIFGRLGGPSSTSTAEAGPWILLRSSTLQGSQVVRPRIPGGGRRWDCFVGRESSSSLLSDFGGNA